jgi:two-component system, sensor histidine kinase YesM
MVTLSRRFAALFIALVAVPSVVVSVALSRLYVAALYDTLSRQTEATAVQVSRSVQMEIDSASILAASLLHDDELGSLIEAYAKSSGSAKLEAYARMDAKISSFLIYSNRIGAVEMYLRNGYIYYDSNYPNIRSMPSFDEKLFSEAVAEPDKVYLLDTLRGPAGNVGEKNIVSVAVCPERSARTSLKAILVMTRVPFFDELAARAGPGGGDVVIFGRGGQPLLSSLGPEVASSLAPLVAGTRYKGHFRELRSGGRRYLATTASIDSASWEVALLADMSSISSRIARYSWYLFPALAVIALVSLAFVRTFLASMATPIRDIISSMGRVGKGDYAARASSAGIVELEALTQGFNSMVGEIEGLVAERERREHARLVSELEALRYQINPHFVANTLNSIRLMARAAKADAIAEMSSDLMRVLADCYSGSSSLVELSRELENVKSYIAIMKIRFGKRLDVSFDVQELAECRLSLRMMLQPIVENCILHGFGGAEETASRRGRSGHGRIRIAARVEERDLPAARPPEPGVRVVPGICLVVEVSDDGSGMDEARLASVMKEDASRNGLYRIGVANVRKRIELNFGEPYGLAIRSAPGAGTTVSFLLPAMEREGAADA